MKGGKKKKTPESTKQSLEQNLKIENTVKKNFKRVYIFLKPWSKIYGRPQKLISTVWIDIT